MNKVELLAPCGGLSEMVIAVINGCDAVYFGGEKFSARQSATNFSFSHVQIGRLLTYKYGVKMYLAINTMIGQRELNEAVLYVGEMLRLGVDAFIIQDLGLIKVLRETYKNIEIHCSTQLSIHNSQVFPILLDLGINRVVVPRESSKEDIQGLCNKKMEIEAFVHGAICISYSGKCTLSSLIGGRSGNRGACAQPCRLKYTLNEINGTEFIPVSKEAHLLSPKDMMLLGSTKDLIDLGVSSFKIEGRMKGITYVREVVKAYREKIDLSIEELQQENKIRDNSEETKNLLKDVFNRDYTDAYLKREHKSQLMNFNKPNNRGVLLGRAMESKEGFLTLSLKSPLSIGDRISIFLTKDGRAVVDVEDILINNKSVPRANVFDTVTIFVGKNIPKDTRIFKIFNAAIENEAMEEFLANEEAFKVSLDMYLSGKIGEHLCISGVDEFANEVYIESDFLIEQAGKNPYVYEDVYKQIRINDTMYTLNSLVCDVEAGAFLPKSIINNLRRDLVAALEDKLKESFNKLQYIQKDNGSSYLKSKKDQDLVTKDFSQEENQGFSLFVECENLDQLREGVFVLRERYKELGEYHNEIFLSIPLYPNKGSFYTNEDLWDYLVSLDDFLREKIILVIPDVVRESKSSAFKEFLGSYVSLVGGVKCECVDFMMYAKNLGFKEVIGGSSLNVVNNESLSILKSNFGLTRCEGSKELNFSQLSKLNQELIIRIFGFEKVMHSEYCPLSGTIGCNKSKCSEKRYALRDSKGYDFRLINNYYCQSQIYNGKRLVLSEDVIKLREKGFHNFNINLVFEPKENVRGIIYDYLKLLEKNDPRNIYNKYENYTKGHINRGVM